MKLIFLLLLSQVASADQGKMLSIARDSYLNSAIDKLNEFCKVRRPDLPNDNNHQYICMLQAKADCSHGEEGSRKEACEIVKRVESLEKMILYSDKNLSSVERIPIGVNLSFPKIAEDIPVTTPRSAPDAVNIRPQIPDISHMSNEEWEMRGRPNKQDMQKAANEWRKATNDLNATTVKRSCKESTDCKLIYFGSHGCTRGHEGYIAVNSESQPEEFQKALASYNGVQDRVYKDLKESTYCLAVYLEYKAVCKENVCTGISYSP